MPDPSGPSPSSSTPPATPDSRGWDVPTRSGSEDREQRVRACFARAIALPAGDRAALLDDVRTTDPATADDVASLLRFHDDSTSVLDTSAADLAGRLPTPEGALDEPPVPERLGPYRIVRELGRGGMGVVYEALQESPSRRVALKLVRPELFSASARRRLAREAQALARVQHPAIAQVFGAGAETIAGVPRPYLAMELVDGQPITAWARSTRPAVRGIAELVAQLADAIAHAHTRGVLHRDLKPANILMDKAGRPKILDFGVARLTDDDGESASQTLRTLHAGVVGTPGYMAPELLRAEAPGTSPTDASDPRIDVYALGAVLYELLCGVPAYDVSKLGLLAALDAVRQREPARPSTIRAELAGDLEAIVLRALERDPARRYPSMESLATDLRRWMRFEPVEARPQTPVYRAGRFLRRHRALALSVCGVVLSLSGLLGWALWQTARAERATLRAEDEAATARVVRDYLGDILSQADPAQAQGQQVTIRDAVDKAATNLDARADLRGRPRVLVEVYRQLATTYAGLGEYARALELREKAIALRAGLDRAEGTPARERLAVEADDLRAVVSLLDELDRADEATQRARAMIAEVERARLRGTTTDASARLSLSMALREAGELREAESLAREALAIREKALGPDDGATLNALNMLVLVLRDQGSAEATLPLMQRNLDALQRTVGNDHPDTISALANLSETLGVLGRGREAIALSRDALERARRVWGEDHPNTLSVWLSLGSAAVNAGEFAQAIEILEGLAPIAQRVGGADHLRTLTVLNNLGVAYDRAGRPADAAMIHDRLLDVLERKEPSSFRTAITLANAGRVRRQLGRGAEALALSERSVAALRQNPELARQGPRIAIEHALNLIAVGRFDEGDATARAALEPLMNAPEERLRTLARTAAGQLRDALQAARPDLAAQWAQRGDAVTR